MFSSLLRAHVRGVSSSSATGGSRAFKVSVIGAAGGIGAPLSLLLKQNPLISHLSLYDLAPVTPGVGADLSHINTRAQVAAYTGKDIHNALDGADVVVVPAGMARKPGMTRDDLFSTNASIVAGIAKAVGEAAPNSILLVISNPVNSTLPICAEVLKKLGVYNKRKLFGLTTLDIVRANTFVAEHQGWDVMDTHVPVVCGHSGVTILPLLSQVAKAKFSDADKDAITQRIQTAGDVVVKAKAGGGSATLSMAFAGAQFTDSVLRAMSGEKGIVECTFVESEVQPGVPYFSSPVELGVNGVEKIHGLGQLDAYEAQKLEDALPELKASINKGVQFVHRMSKL